MKKTKSIWRFLFVMMGLTLMIASSCKKDNNTTPPPTPLPVAVTDKDGNDYHSVKIGTQEWMVENLKTTKFNDGTAIPLVTGDAAWTNLLTPAYCWFNNNTGNKNIYGALYNFPTIYTGLLCPSGWHIPSDAEWTTLTDYLGGLDVAGGKMKETGTTHWNAPNTEATNTSGFTALPGGYRIDYGNYLLFNRFGYYWSSTSKDASNSWIRFMDSNYAYVVSDARSKSNGYSVRCLKD